MSDSEQITALHGAGGEVMEGLLAKYILPRFASRSSGRIGLAALDDGATVDAPADAELVVTTDSHVVKPIFFPGGDIGTLAAAGTINDLAMMGAKPLALTLAAIIEEGFPFADLERVLDSFAGVLRTVGVPVICGDTKVMPRADLDGIVLNTTGVGAASPAIGDAGFSPEDRVILTGSIGDHGMALLAAREDFRLATTLESDVSALWPLIKRALAVGGIRAMKDPTRGGLAAALNEMARKANLCLTIQETSIPIKDSVRGMADVLGISPYEVANEGKAILIVEPKRAEDVLLTLRGHPLGADAALVGSVTAEYPGRVILETPVGGRRFLDMPLGDPVPRIC